MNREYSKHGDVLTFKFLVPGFSQDQINALAHEVVVQAEGSDEHPDARVIMQDTSERAVRYELFHRLIDQARTLLAFMREHNITWDAEDDRNDELRAADFIAARAGYTATTTPSYSEIVVGIEGALVSESRPTGGLTRADQAPEWTP